MTFAAPLFLLAALAAAIPVVLHMMNRQKAKELPFSTLRFLKISVEKTRRRKRIHDVLLMALRAAVLLMIAAGLARPAVTSLGGLWGGAHSAVVVILDNSASMGMIDQDRPRFETATAAAIQILDQLGEGDEVALLADLRSGLPRCRQARPHARRRPPNPRAVPRQLRTGRPGSGDSTGPGTAGQVGSPQQADLCLDRHAEDLWEQLKTQEERRKVAMHTSPAKALTLALSRRERGQRPSRQARIPNPQSRRERRTKAKPPSPNPESPIPTIIVDCNRQPKPNVAVQGIDWRRPCPWPACR